MLNRDLTQSLAVACAIVLSSSTLAADSIYVDSTGNVGVGTSTPSEKLHVQDGNLLVQQSSANAILKFASGAHAWDITQNATTGRLVFFYPGGGAITGSFKFDPAGQENLLRVGVTAGDTVDINGNLTVSGAITGPAIVPDYVYGPEYKLESIEDHADFMWKNRHLPSLPKAPAGYQGNVDLVGHQMGMLEELEKAHIYIDQLNQSVSELRSELASTRKEIAKLRTASLNDSAE
jgi:hypothetical protein